MSFTVEKLKELGIEPVDSEDMTLQMLNDCYDAVKIGSLAYEAGEVLKKIDPVAFRECVNDYMDALIEDEYLTEIDGELFQTEDIKTAHEEDEAV